MRAWYPSVSFLHLHSPGSQPGSGDTRLVNEHNQNKVFQRPMSQVIPELIRLMAINHHTGCPKGLRTRGLVGKCWLERALYEASVSTRKQVSRVSGQTSVRLSSVVLEKCGVKVVKLAEKKMKLAIKTCRGDVKIQALARSGAAGSMGHIKWKMLFSWDECETYVCTQNSTAKRECGFMMPRKH